MSGLTDGAATPAAEPTWQHQHEPFVARWGNASECVVAVDRELRIIWGNDALAVLTGETLEAWAGHDPLRFVHPDDVDRAVTSFAGLEDHPGRRAPASYRIRAATGWVLARVSGLNLLDDPGYAAMVLELRLIDDEQRAEALATDQYETMERILAGQPLATTLLEITHLVERHGDKVTAAVLLVDGDRFVVSAAPNLPPAVRDLLHDLPVEQGLLTCNEAIVRADCAVTADVTTDPLWARHAEVAAEAGVAACWSVAIIDPTSRSSIGTLEVFRTEPGEPRFEQWAVPVLGARLAGIAIDRSGWIAELEHRSAHDHLTGLLNRSAFSAVLDDLLSQLPQPDRLGVGMLFVDVDRFKVINDTHGHANGDVVLQEVSRRLRTEVAASAPDGVVARLGGDEFVIAWPGAHDAGDAVHLAEQIRQALEAPLAIGPLRVAPRSSIGIAIARAGDGVSADVLIRNADAALNRAKAEGRNRWVFYDEALRLQHLERRSVEADLELALERHELRVYFQPVVHLATGQLAGVEALVRWEHPTRGLLVPAAFIDIAEDAGLVTAIDEAVLTDALPLVDRWNGDRSHRDLDPLTLWVNLSAHHLLQPEAVDRILAIAGTDRAPLSLGVELTESALLGDPVAAAGLLARLRGAGIGVAIDDFGTGYSSLAALRSLPATHLKVDRRFVTGLLTDPRDRAIVEATLQLAHSFGLGVTAEGVETREQADELAAMGCDLAQGYLYGRPVSGADLEAGLGRGLSREAVPSP